MFFTVSPSPADPPTPQPPSLDDTLPVDVKGPVMSVSTITAVVVAIILFASTISIMCFFSRRRRKGRNATAHSSDVELSAASSTWSTITLRQPEPAFMKSDQQLPAYSGKDVNGPPEYTQQRPAPAT